MQRGRYQLKQSHALASVSSIIVIVLLMFGVGGMQQPVVATAADAAINYAGMFRVDVDVRDAYDRARIDEAGIVVLSDASDSVRVLVDTMQRAQLADWGMVPYNVVSVAELGVDAPPLARSSGTVIDQYKRSLRVASPQRAWASALSASTKLKLAAEVAPDSDGDGLTDTQEMEWCTDINNINTDGDKVTDFYEISLLIRWARHELDSAPNTGAPFSLIGSKNPLNNKDNCLDQDAGVSGDYIPDKVEDLYLNFDSYAVSTDRDTYSDSQELYGNIPIIMPKYVLYPGNHPLVAAHPVPDISIVEGSIRVDVVTNITTEKGTISQVTKSFEHTTTKGNSLSKEEGETWNKWKEVSTSKVDSDQRIAPLIVVGVVFRVAAPIVVKAAARKAIPYISKKAGPAIIKQGGKLIKKYGPAVVKSAVGGGISKFFGLDDKVESALRWAFPDEDKPVRECKQVTTLENGNNSVGSQGECVERTTNAVQNLENDRGSASQAGNMYMRENNQILRQGFQDVTNALLAPRRTDSSGSSKGGYTSIVNTQYEETSIMQGESFTTGEDWRTASATNSAHAANLRFTYKMRNLGTDYVSLSGVKFNIYLNNDPNPIVTYDAGSIADIAPFGAPNTDLATREKVITSQPVALTLQQLRDLDVHPDCLTKKAIGEIPESSVCPGGKLRVVLSSYSYTGSYDYQNAVQGGVVLHIDDGFDDGDESIDTYVLPTFNDDKGNPEPLVNVIQRAFPVDMVLLEDGSPEIVAIWVPEPLDASKVVPDWCETKASLKLTNRVYCKHAVSTADSWTVYSTRLTGDVTSYMDTRAEPNSIVMLKFRQDSDRDGYPDNVEDRLGTDPNSLFSSPEPDVVGGLTQYREGNEVQAVMSLLNTSPSDAYGVEAVMIAPDDSIFVTNNYIGGGGRVNAFQQIAVGSGLSFDLPMSDAWNNNGYASPLLSGYYSGDTIRRYRFTASCDAGVECIVGKEIVTVVWRDNLSQSGVLQVGNTYMSPNMLAVGDLGLKIGFMSGKVTNGASFDVIAYPPLEKFTYRINREPFTEPLVFVTSNHMGGWYQSLVPTEAMNLKDPNDNLVKYASNISYDLDMQILSNTPVKVGSNTTYIAVNNPSLQTIKQGRIYLEVIAPDGYRTAIFEKQLDFVNGPTVVPMEWSTNKFTTPYNAKELFTMRVMWTDYQDTIIRKAYRDLSNLGVNNFPVAEVLPESLNKDFGIISGGMPAKYVLHIANTGDNSLVLLHSQVEHVQSNMQGTNLLPIGAVGELQFSLDTGNMPAGRFTKTIPIRTSDPLQPLLTVQLSGEIVAADSAVVTYIPDPYKPLEQAVYVKGPQAALAPVTYNNAIVTDQGRVQPVALIDDLTEAHLGRGKAVASVWEQLMPVPMATARESRESGAVTVAPRALVDSGWVEVCGVNCDFEYGNMHGWVQDGGNFDVRNEYPLHGRYAVKGTSANQAGFYRDVNISQYATHVDAGFGTFSTNAWMDIGKSESSAVTVQFLNASMQEITRNGTGWVGRIGGGYGLISRTGGIPSGTRYLRLRIDVRRSAHSYTDVDVDSVSLQVRMQGNAVGTVAGTVYADLNQNGVRDVGEPAVSDVQVILDEALSVRTDAQGGYRFTGVDVGTHQVRIVLPAQYTALSATQPQIAVAINQQTNVDFRLQPYSSVTGSVYLDMDADGVRDAGEQGVAGVVIAVGTQQVSTDADGKYVINGVPTGSLTIGITQSNGYVAIGDASVTKNIGLAEAVQADFGVLNYVADIAPGSGGATMRMFVPDAIAQSARYVVRNGIEMSFDGPNVTQTTYVTLPNTEYLTVSMEILSIGTLTGNTRVDIGDNGSNDWMPSLNGVGRHVNNALVNPVEEFRKLWGGSGATINVPIKITSASNTVGGKLLIYNVVAVPKPTVDLSVAGVMIANSRSMSSGRSNASTNVPINTTRYVNATIHNNGTSASEPMSVAAVADVTDFGPWYVGSVLVPALPAKGTYNVSIPFTTQSWEAVTGTMQLLVDPYGAIPESTESNNNASIGFAVYDPSNSGLTPGQLTQTAVSAGQTATAIVRGTQIAENTTATAIVRATNSAIAGATQTVVAMNSTATAAAQATEKASVNAVRTATAGARQTSVSAQAQTKVALGKTVVAQRQATTAARSTAKAAVASTKVAAQKTAVAGKMATQRAVATAKANAKATVVSAKQTAVAAQAISKARTATAISERIALTTTRRVVEFWESGDGQTRLHTPRAGEICYGAQVGKLQRRDVSYVVYFTSTTNDIAITSGRCEIYGRSLVAIATQVRRDYADLTWQVVSDYASAAPRPEPRYWETGPRELSYSPQAGEICWGEYVGRYRQPGTSYVVYFATNSAPITIFNGACERHGRTFTEIVRWVTTGEEYSDLRWQVIAPYVSN